MYLSRLGFDKHIYTAECYVSLHAAHTFAIYTLYDVQPYFNDIIIIYVAIATWLTSS